MSKLAAYNPLSKIKFGGVEIVDPSGLIVVTGPNSSGKTHLLRDIEGYLTSGEPSGVVCKQIAPRKPADIRELFSDLLGRRLVRQIPDGERRPTEHFEINLPQFPRSGPPGRQWTRQRFKVGSLENAAGELTGNYGVHNPGFFQAIGLSFVTYLPLESRLRVCERSTRFNHDMQAPETTLQGLQHDSHAQNVIARETGRVFGNAVWLDISEHDSLQLRASGQPQIPLPGEMTNPARSREYLPIQEEGDGLQSYVGACIALLLGLRPVVLLDEPELCLHPPQAYQMGRFIGEQSGASQLTVVATHSSHILRGVLDAGRPATVVRLTHREREFSASIVPDPALRAAVRNPRSRAEATLDGAFARAVVLVESDGDREVYQAACEAAPGYPSREVHFVCTGGTGGFAEVCSFYAALRVPAAVIADLDVLADPGRLLSVLSALNPGADLTSCHEVLHGTAQAVKALPSAVTESAVREKLRELAAEELRWERGDDGRLRAMLNRISKSVYRVGRLKEGGLDAYAGYPDLRGRLLTAVEACKAYGVFIVPVGELEYWVPGLMSGVAESMGKLDRAYEMAARVRSAPDKSGDVWAFSQAVLDYLDTRAVAAGATRSPR